MNYYILECTHYKSILFNYVIECVNFGLNILDLRKLASTVV